MKDGWNAWVFSNHVGDPPQVLGFYLASLGCLGYLRTEPGGRRFSFFVDAPSSNPAFQVDDKGFFFLSKNIKTWNVLVLWPTTLASHFWARTRIPVWVLAAGHLIWLAADASWTSNRNDPNTWFFDTHMEGLGGVQAQGFSLAGPQLSRPLRSEPAGWKVAFSALSSPSDLTFQINK